MLAEREGEGGRGKEREGEGGRGREVAHLSIPVRDYTMKTTNPRQGILTLNLLQLRSLFEANGNQEGDEHSLACVKYYKVGGKDNWTNSQQLTWARKRMHGGGEDFWYDVVDVADILGPAFVVPNFKDRNTEGPAKDTFYICPWQR
jgi:hypothetical protein